jgi:methionyl-tRNA formyltransferase
MNSADSICHKSIVLLAGEGSTYAAAVLRALERQGLRIDAVIIERTKVVRRVRARLRKYGLAAMLLRGLEIVIFSVRDKLCGSHRTERIESVAAKLGVRVERIDELNSDRALALLSRLRPALGILGGTGKLCQAIVCLFPLGLLNAHHGILPKYRGNFGNRWALWNNDDCGLSVYIVDEGLDTGPIVQVQALQRFPYEWLWDLEARVTEMCAEAVAAAAKRRLCGKTYAEPQARSDGRLFGLQPVCVALRLYARLWRASRRADRATAAYSSERS